MSLLTTTTSSPDLWKEAGQAWGARSTDWAYLFEPYARPANELVLDQVCAGAGVRLLGSRAVAPHPGEPLGDLVDVVHSELPICSG